MKKRSKFSTPSRADAAKVYKWCMEKYGRSKFNGSYPIFTYRKSDYLTEGIFGEYDWIENILFISKDKNTTLRDLIDTMIHEWIHYLQPIRSHYRKMAKKGKLNELFEDKDPLEKEARKIAKRDRNKCFKELFQN